MIQNINVLTTWAFNLYGSKKLRQCTSIITALFRRPFATSLDANIGKKLTQLLLTSVFHTLFYQMNLDMMADTVNELMPAFMTS